MTALKTLGDVHFQGAKSALHTNDGYAGEMTERGKTKSLSQ